MAKNDALAFSQIRKDPKINVLFIFQSATVWASLEDLFFSCKNDDRFHVVLALYEEVVVEKGHISNARSFLDHNNYDYVEYSTIDFNLYRPHIVFIQLPYDTSCHAPNALSLKFVRKGIRVIYVPYGNETADTEEVRRIQYENFVVENAWRVYTGTVDSLMEYKKYCRNREAVRCVGIPKYDSIIKQDCFKLDDYIQKCKGDRKLIVWKIHFPKRDATADGPRLVTPELTQYFAFLNYIRHNSDIFFVILAHPKLLNMDVSSLVYRDENQMNSIPLFLKEAQQIDNVYIDSSADYRNTLYNADAIIMDRSGLLVEVAIRNIPTLYLLNEEYQEKYLGYVDEILKTFHSGHTSTDMINFVESLKNGVDEWHNVRPQVVQRAIPFLDGNCCARVKEDIVHGLETNQESRIRVVLYGCGSVCDYYMDKQGWATSDKFEIVAVVDSNNLRWGMDFYGYVISAPEELKELVFDAIVITSEMFYYDIKKHLVYELFIDERKIKRLDEFAVDILELE